VSRAAQGLHAWLLQRVTAVYLAVYLLAMSASLLIRGVADYSAWRARFGEPWTGVLTAIFAMAVLLHVWVGIREVLIDYVHAVWLRLSLLAVFGLVLFGSLLWVLRALALAALPGVN
jgi:succinate dehydrogenase / fumarate reductase, membrane anchor subunit